MLLASCVFLSTQHTGGVSDQHSVYTLTLALWPWLIAFWHFLNSRCINEGMGASRSQVRYAEVRQAGLGSLLEQGGNQPVNCQQTVTPCGEWEKQLFWLQFRLSGEYAHRLLTKNKGAQVKGIWDGRLSSFICSQGGAGGGPAHTHGRLRLSPRLLSQRALPSPRKSGSQWPRLRGGQAEEHRHIQSTSAKETPTACSRA